MAEISIVIINIIFVVLNILSGLFIFHAYRHFNKGQFKNIVKWLLLNILLIILIHIVLAAKDFSLIPLDIVFYVERGLLILSAIGLIYLGWLFHKFAEIYGFQKITKEHVEKFFKE